ncbi:uncharacterized protein M6B38_350865 [Iris pallida]|uniref:Uncharacterized protein n=1 Tax=Iris pallida TaxID=29817 RepID=A0AAX6GSE0_IRIPA|nr:Uncharacterized protein M6B38_229040 [Iris pallida]KAJ6831245.1 uncharacterized protein M6B38_350865 [Iris pallida]
MKPPKSMVSLIFLLVVVGTSQGIRFEEELIAAFRRIAHKESFIGGGEAAAGGAPCRDDGLCSSGRSRELREKALAMANSKITDHWSKEKDVDRNSKSEAEKRKGQEKKEHEEEQASPDVLDISGMDYSPARRKPPIHN